MKPINQTSLRLAVLLAAVLLASEVVARPPRSTKQTHWFQQYYDGTNFDLNDEFAHIPHLRAAHRQETVPAETDTTLTTDTTVDADAPTMANVVKNDELLPTNLFVTPPILLNETHPKSESSGYLQVLQAMKYTPVVATGSLTTRDIQARGSLNSVLLKLLTTTSQITSAARSSVTSSSVTINDILQSYSGLVFGNTYREFNQTPNVAIQPIPVVPVPLGNTTVVNYDNGTTVALSGDYNVDLNGTIVSTGDEVLPITDTVSAVVPEEVVTPVEETVITQTNSTDVTPVVEATTDAQAEAVAQAEEQALKQLEAEAPTAVSNSTSEEVAPDAIAQAEDEIPKRLLTLLRMYAEHVEYKDKDVIADEKHYGHLRSFDRHLHCLIDDQCDFSKHLLDAPDAVPRTKHFLEAYIAGKKDITSAHAAEFQGEVLNLISSLPSLTSNDDIKRITGDWIVKNQKFLDDFGSAWPGINVVIQGQIGALNTALPAFQNLTPDQFLSALDTLSKSYKAKIDQEFTANGLTNKTNELIEMKTGVEQLHGALRAVIPANGVLDSDFSELEQKLAKHIDVFRQAQGASEAQLVAARTKLKNNLQLQINGIDAVANTDLIRQIANDADGILRSDFGKSLNQDNLNFIVQKALNAFRTDFAQLKDGQKSSGFILDQSDLQRLADDVVDELKRGRESNQKVILDLTDLNRYVQGQNRLFSAAPNSGDAANDAADLLISYENYFYDALSSDDFSNSLKDYIARYYDVYYAHVVPLEPFFNYSAAYKTLTAGLNNPNALGNLNPVAVRLLRGSGELQVRHLAHLSATDKQFFHLLDRLTAEWAQTTNPAGLSDKLATIIQAIQGKQIGNDTPHLLAFSQEHMLLEVFGNVQNAVLGVVTNLGTGATAATNLAQTIGYGQQLVKSAAEQYQVADLLTNNSTSSGLLGGVKNTVKGWLGYRNLEVHYGLADTLTSVRNLWGSISEAKNSADKLQATIGEAQGLANDVQQGLSLFNSVVGNAA